MGILDDYKKLLSSLNKQQAALPAQFPAASLPPTPDVSPETQELIKQRRVADVLQQMQQTANANASKMHEVAAATATLIKGFSPTALAKLIAQDAELQSLIANALFLAPAYQPDSEKPNDPPHR